MEIQTSRIPGCFELIYNHRPDARGTFIKTMQSSVFAGMGLEFSWVESFVSISETNVLRGMHLQLAPADGAKLVVCLSGEILDVTLDLRKSSETFGQTASFPLSGKRISAVYVPAGVAHGFYVTDGPATVLYYISAEYHPALDTGIHWNSFDFAWPMTAPILSQRDANLPAFKRFSSPFE